MDSLTHALLIAAGVLALWIGASALLVLWMHGRPRRPDPREDDTEFPSDEALESLWSDRGGTLDD